MSPKKLRLIVIMACFKSMALFKIIAPFLVNHAVLQRGKQPRSIDIERVLEEEGLERIGTDTDRSAKRDWVIPVLRKKDSRFCILKAAHLNPLEAELNQAAYFIANKMAFRVPAVLAKGEGWLLFEDIKGESLKAFSCTNLSAAINTSFAIAQSYHSVIKEIEDRPEFSRLLEDGQEWLFSRLAIWGKIAADAGFIESSLVMEIGERMKEIIACKGADFFGWVHGNIIGDHVVISKGKEYLLDLNAVPRIGGQYYDFLRAMDFMFINAKNPETAFNIIVHEIDRLCSAYDEAEVRLVVAFRFIGVLGWDLIGNEGMAGFDKKAELAVRFIKGEY